ncbi:MAG: 3-hydroxyisobutyryl-CoA hydrolase [Corynebacterium casei]|nr:3-hydroxyisobutyryl-CoA hydrolase [Corynebacterium casei]
MTETAESTAPVLTSVRQRTGLIELNRPKALNSLTPEMIDIIGDAVRAWENDDSIDQIVLYTTNPKAFCAGGDVRYARDNIVDGNAGVVDDFFASEYTVNGELSNCTKPLIAIINGVVMGGGLGISIHGSHRVVTENAFASMPEMSIGYFTDVGVSHAAQRMVGTRGKSSTALAKYWSITGYRMYAADMLWSGAATHVVKDADEILEAIIAHGVEAALEKHSYVPEEEAPLASVIEHIESTFNRATWAEIQEALKAADKDFANQTAEYLASACPTSVVASNELFEAHAKEDDIVEALKREESLGRYIRSREDFIEGVRAVLVEKTRDAAFNPADTAEVDLDAIHEALKI